jgi:hypothetical protein
MAASTLLDSNEDSSMPVNIEIIDAVELARRWRVPTSWIRAYSRERCAKDERIPHLQFGRYVRFEWGSPALEAWLVRRRQGAAQ